MEENVEDRNNKFFLVIVEWSFCVVLAIIIALITRYYFVTSIVVRQSSMYPTLQEKQRLLVNRTNRIGKSNYKKEDIIIFEAPSRIQTKSEIDILNPIALYEDEQKKFIEKFKYYILEFNKVSYIKRIIALEGDRVQIIEGNVYVNGKKLQEDYLSEGTVTTPGFYNDIIVPEGYVYVLGDNRQESIDSRIFGCILEDKIEGKVMLRYWPFNKFDWI